MSEPGFLQQRKFKLNMNWKEHQKKKKNETPHFSMELLGNAFHFSASFFLSYTQAVLCLGRLDSQKQWIQLIKSIDKAVN